MIEVGLYDEYQLYPLPTYPRIGVGVQHPPLDEIAAMFKVERRFLGSQAKQRGPSSCFLLRATHIFRE